MSKARLLRLTSEALADVSSRRDSDELMEGAVCAFPGDAVRGVLWIVLEREAGSALFVGADQHPLAGPCDVAIPAGESGGPLTVRCDFTARCDGAGAISSTVLSSEVLQKIRTKQVEIKHGALSAFDEQEEALFDPEYEDLLELLAESTGGASRAIRPRTK